MRNVGFLAKTMEDFIMKKYSKSIKKFTQRVIVLSISIFFVNGCSTSLPDVGINSAPSNKESKNKSSPNTFSQFQDIPLPDGSEMDLDRTVVLGAPEKWVGRLVLAVSLHPSKAFDFFKQQTPSFGWEEVSSVRSATSFLTYTSSDRALTIQISGKTLRGSELILTMSPKGSSLQTGFSKPPVNKLR